MYLGGSLALGCSLSDHRGLRAPAWDRIGSHCIEKDEVVCIVHLRHTAQGLLHTVRDMELGVAWPGLLIGGLEYHATHVGVLFAAGSNKAVTPF